MKAYSLRKTECMFLEVVTIHAGGAKVGRARQPLVAPSAISPSVKEVLSSLNFDSLVFSS